MNGICSAALIGGGDSGGCQYITRLIVLPLEMEELDEESEWVEWQWE